MGVLNTFVKVIFPLKCRRFLACIKYIHKKYRTSKKKAIIGNLIDVYQVYLYIFHACLNYIYKKYCKRKETYALEVFRSTWRYLDIFDVLWISKRAHLTSPLDVKSVYRGYFSTSYRCVGCLVCTQFVGVLWMVMCHMCKDKL